jgi:hypothetical protein
VTQAITCEVMRVRTRAPAGPAAVFQRKFTAPVAAPLKKAVHGESMTSLIDSRNPIHELFEPPFEAARDPRAQTPLAEPTRIGARPVVEIVVPVHNRAGDLDRKIRFVHRWLTRHAVHGWRLTIVDGASSDTTGLSARFLSLSLPSVLAIHSNGLDIGRALRLAWSISDAPTVAYLDVDRTDEISLLGGALTSLLAGDSDVVIDTGLLVLRAELARSLLPEIASDQRRLFTAAVVARARHRGLRVMTLRASDDGELDLRATVTLPRAASGSA